MKRVAGFTLVEIALVVVIASILLMAGLKLLNVRMETAQLEVTQKHQEAIKQALISYLGKYRRLPCPDVAVFPALPDGVEDRTGAPCTAFVGGVPYVDLGLDRSIALDGWENYITYAVSPNWVYTYSASATPPTQSAAAPTTPFSATAAFWPGISLGLISAYKNTTTLFANPCTTTQLLAPPNTGGVVALISYGKNGYGAINIMGQQNIVSANADETQNASPNLQPTVPYPAIAGCPQDMLKIVKRDPGSTAIDSYDDLVMVVNDNDLTGPLFASGALSQSQDANALAQANNALLGAIISSRLPCPGAIGCTGSYYYTVPAAASPQPQFSTEVSALGVVYTPNSIPPAAPPCTAIAPACAYLVSPGIAFDGSTFTSYTITAPTGTSKTVSINDITGLINLKGAGF